MNDDVLVLGRKFGTGSSVPEMFCKEAREIALAVKNGEDKTPDEVAVALEHTRTCPSCNPDVQ